MWQEAREKVAEIFFKDTVQVYKNTPAADAIGEELDNLTLLGEYACNIENGQSGVSRDVSGTTTPQTLRISLTKAIPLSYGHTYKLKIKDARIAYDATEYWKVDGWTEGQISTVISASREVAV